MAWRKALVTMGMSALVGALAMVSGVGACHKPPGPEGAYGVSPSEAMALPVFSAINADGKTRTRDDLLGKPTVMWFFPAAGTPG